MTRGVRPSPRQAPESETTSAALRTRNAERGTRNRWADCCSAFQLPRSAFVLPHIGPLERQQVGKEPIRAGDPRRQLPEERQSRVDVGALADAGHEQPALE